MIRLNQKYWSYQFGNWANSLLKTGTLLFLLGACKATPEKPFDFSGIEKLVHSGELKKAGLLADSIKETRILGEINLFKLDSIVEIARRIPIDFSLKEADVITRLNNYFPYLDSGMMHRWERNRKLEMRLIDGEKRYFNMAVSNLFLLDDEAKICKTKVDGLHVDSLDIFCINHTRKVTELTKTIGGPVLPVRMKLNYTITVKPNVIPNGKTIRCWMPFPREGHSRQKDIRLLKSNPEQASVAPASDLQRTIYLEKKAEKDRPTVFNIEFEFETAAQYFDLKPEHLKPYDTSSAVYKEFTAERPPQIVFTDEIKQLANLILDGETNPLLQTQKIYNWINGSIRWASALEYGTIPNIPEYVLKNHHGDCGMQTLLFMTLARSQGIPVKWQSGWMLHPGEVNLHDWCEVYFEAVGWVPVDQSFGLQNDAGEKVRNFYRSGIDAYRLIVNDDYARKLTPDKKYIRSEPYDFQRGELEWERGNLYFDKWDWHMEVEYQ
ncbi:MAG: cysteine protease [Odoribacter sp.]|nr:cysteine protease [Odoribacter sp.]